MPLLSRFRSSTATLAAAVLLGACAAPPGNPGAPGEGRLQGTPTASSQPEAGTATISQLPSGTAALSLSQSGTAEGGLPVGWRPWVIRRDKTPTRYQVARLRIDGEDRPVLHAVARAAASGVWVPLGLRAVDAPYVRWSWRTDAMIERADSSRPETEDAPARLVLAFDGDWSKLPLREQMLAETARMLLGQEVPYATLIYTWDSHMPVGATMVNAHSSRVRMKVVQSGPRDVGRWLDYERNYVHDYSEMFGEAPGTLIGIGVMTDTDNTRGYAESWYGDIQLLTPSRTALGELPDGPVID